MITRLAGKSTSPCATVASCLHMGVTYGACLPFAKGRVEVTGLEPNFT